ncbi:uncharacterized protein Triagg1_10306 [Trichoderma aggressivum f. europaeum]|uniref:Uncharacterized protein n=1 Tax=Trichoderma aggressivum f. europaeum TaxID=173218 RepID=A0AAE1I960_9HYPO|nr:hypothetical protein Triagg1_10306 [Trichoderma aggressivum f. europaeum]
MSGNEPNPVGTEQPSTWEEKEIPSDFAQADLGYFAERRRRLARSSAPKSEHGSLTTTATAELNKKHEDGESIGATDVIPPNADDHTNPAVSGIAVLDEQSCEGEQAEKSETESLMGEESPTLEGNEMPLSVVDNNETESSFPQDLAQELELAAASDERDEEDGYNPTTRENSFPVNLSQSSRLISSDGAMDAAIETGNNIVSSIDRESNQNPEANLDEILAERDSLRKKIEPQDDTMEAMRRENALLKEHLESCRKIISAREAEITALKKTTVKTIPSANVGTNTETPARQFWQPNSPRKDDNEQGLISSKKPSPSPPVSLLAMQKATAVRFIRPFLVMAKDLYFDFAKAVNVGSVPISLSGMAYFFRNWAQIAVTFLATPFWVLMSFSVYVSMQHERSLWLQANALTRKQLLGHVSGAAGEWNWDILCTIGSVILWYYVHL